jgi:hypothetical protein
MMTLSRGAANLTIVLNVRLNKIVEIKHYGGTNVLALSISALTDGSISISASCINFLLSSYYWLHAERGKTLKAN